VCMINMISGVYDSVAISLEAERRHRIISELVPLHDTIESNSVHLSALLSSCVHPQYLHSSMTSSVDVTKRIVAKSLSIVSRAQHGDATASDVSMLLELASQSRKIIDSATVQVGKRSSAIIPQKLATITTEVKTGLFCNSE